MNAPTNLVDVLNSIRLANNGYIFASNLTPEFVRRAEQLVKRNTVLKDTLKNNGVLETAYFSSYFAWKCAIESEM